jgi:hypothetical protein
MSDKAIEVLLDEKRSHPPLKAVQKISQREKRKHS